jgi:hypothetical protein
MRGEDTGESTAADGGLSAVTRSPPAHVRLGRWLTATSPETPYLLGHLLALSVPVVLLVALHPLPLVHPDPAEFRRVGLAMVSEGRLLVAWDPPVRYFPLYVLYALLRPAGLLADRLAVLQAAVFSYLLTPLALYGFVATVRSRRAGLLALTASALATAAGVPPTAVVWHHWQFDAAVPYAVAGLALAWATLRADERGADRRTVGLALATAAVGGLTLNTEPWVALFLAVGVACAWVAHHAWRAVAAATLLGALAALPLFAVPNWQVHLTLFVVDVIDPGGPLLSAAVLAEALSAPGTYGTLGLLGLAWWLRRRGHPLPGGLVTGFALLVGGWTWVLFRFSTLGGIGTRGLLWLLTLGVPVVTVQVVDALPRENPLRRSVDRLLEEGRAGEWLALYAAEAAVLAVSVLLFVVTFRPPAPT